MPQFVFPPSAPAITLAQELDALLDDFIKFAGELRDKGQGRDADRIHDILENSLRRYVAKLDGRPCLELASECDEPPPDTERAPRREPE